jgi:hypothetical protein
MIIWFRMKYKSFPLVLLAVSCLFGHIAFAGTDAFDVKQLSPWWLEGIPEPQMVREVELLDEELLILGMHKGRYELMEQRFIATQQALADDLVSKEKVLADLVAMRKEIQGTIKKQMKDTQKLDEELVYLENELGDLEKKQAE